MPKCIGRRFRIVLTRASKRRKFSFEVVLAIIILVLLISQTNRSNLLTDKWNYKDEKPNITYIHETNFDWKRLTRTRILQVTTAFSSIAYGGGIGTAIQNLVEHLAGSKNIEITILYCSSVTDESLEFHKSRLSEQGIEFHALLSENGVHDIHGSEYQVLAFKAFMWVLDRDNMYDAILYHDFIGIGYYIATAKQQGIAFQDTKIVCQSHSTLKLSDQYNSRRPKSVDTLLYYHMEKSSVELADFRTSPSRWYFEWMLREGYQLPSEGNVILGNTLSPEIKVLRTRPYHPKTLVFFGRFEVLKGFYVFLDSLDYLVQKQLIMPKKVLFLGPLRNNVSIGDVILSRSLVWPFPHEIIETSTVRALQIIERNLGLVVCPSLVDTMSYTVLESLSRRIPVITTRVGGIPEIMLQPDRCDCFTENDPTSISMKVHEILLQGQKDIQLSNLIVSAPKQNIYFYSNLLRRPSNGKAVEAPAANLAFLRSVVKNPLGMQLNVGEEQHIIITNGGEDGKPPLEIRVMNGGSEKIYNSAGSKLHSTLNHVLSDLNADFVCALPSGARVSMHASNRIQKCIKFTGADIVGSSACYIRGKKPIIEVGTSVPRSIVFWGNFHGNGMISCHTNPIDVCKFFVSGAQKSCFMQNRPFPNSRPR
ncbi:hypothetical protein M9435_004533 [Picochlorum sp. BPE23]|nr:hypothetical protein M9435_004533 [Picochlorum sp. BPE23]